MRHRRERPRVPALDGVRALAVVAVLLFHGGVGWLPGGFLGVDAFFVLSGFLITGILLAEWRRSGRVDLWAFWARRARRLLPALVVLVVVVAVVSRLVLPSAEQQLLRGDALAALGYLANWRMILRGTDYFTQTATPSPLQHTWSLGIEEQFYLLWPLVVLVLLRWPPLRGRARAGLLAAAALGALSSVALGWTLAGPAAELNRIYFGSDTRAVSILVGCVLAIVLDGRTPGASPSRRSLAAAALAGTAFTAWMWAHADGADPALYRGPLLLVALAVAAVLAHVALVPDSATARLLSLPPLPALGRISYGVYLWHWPLFGWLDAERTGLGGPRLLLVRCAATLVVATASYLLVERPLLHGMRWGSRHPRRVLAAAAVVLILTAGGLVVNTGAEPTQTSALGGAPGAGDGPAFPVLPPVPAATGSSLTPHRHTPGAPLTVDVFGDSMAWTLVTYLPALPAIRVHDRTMMGCGIALGGPYRYFGSVQQPRPECAGWPGLLQQATVVDQPDVVLILVGRWETMDRVHDGRWTHLGDPVFDDYLRGELDRAVSIAAARGARVLVCTEPYNHRGERPDGGLWPEDQPERVDEWNTLVRQAVAAHPADARLVELGARLDPSGRFTWQVDGVQVRSDGVHLTPSGVRWLVPWLLPQLAAAP